MNKFIYYSVLVAVFFVLWAIMVTIFVVMENFGYKAGPVLFSISAAIIFGITGAIKPWLKKKLEKKKWQK
jgi:hypothetical protein